MPHTEISKYEKIKSFSYIFISLSFKDTIWRWFTAFLLQSFILCVIGPIFYQQYVFGSTEHSDSDHFSIILYQGNKAHKCILTFHSSDKNGWISMSRSIQVGQVLQALESCCHGSDTSSGAPVPKMHDVAIEDDHRKWWWRDTSLHPITSRKHDL